jgi:hypothetical protein
VKIIMVNSEALKSQYAVLFLENLLLRERLDLKAWNTREMGKNMLTMKEILDRAQWSAKETKASVALKNQIDALLQIIKNKDATLVDAGHTHLEQAVGELRMIVFGF